MMRSTNGNEEQASGQKAALSAARTTACSFPCMCGSQGIGILLMVALQPPAGWMPLQQVSKPLQLPSVSTPLQEWEVSTPLQL